MGNKRIIPLFILLSLTALVFLIFQLWYRLRQDKVDYNIVLITIDTLRTDHLGCYGYHRNTSPFIDQLAKEGIIFRNAFASSSHTSPSHASIFTALHPVQHQILLNGQRFKESPNADEIFTMADMFQNAGFETAAFSSVNFLTGLRKGFDLFNCPNYRDKKNPIVRQTLLPKKCLIGLNKKKHRIDSFYGSTFTTPTLPYDHPQIVLK